MSNPRRGDPYAVPAAEDAGGLLEVNSRVEHGHRRVEQRVADAPTRRIGVVRSIEDQPAIEPVVGPGGCEHLGIAGVYRPSVASGGERADGSHDVYRVSASEGVVHVGGHRRRGDRPERRPVGVDRPGQFVEDLARAMP